MRIREPKLSQNSYQVLMNRCARVGANGKYIETPGKIFARVAKYIAAAEINWGGAEDILEAEGLFFDAMVENRFVCTTIAMLEAGNADAAKQLSPCFVMPVRDSIEEIFSTLGKAALVQRYSGGTGFNFSRIRPHNDAVRGIPNAASGPVDFLQVYSAALSRVKQSGRKHGGNMGILNADHPDIYEFIKVKDVDGTMKNFNVSVGVTNEFMKAVLENKKWKLVNLRNHKVIQTIRARKLFHDICAHAWLTGDPGMIFLDAMERDNYTPALGILDATNPCGEQPLLPFESCNLSSIVLPTHIKKQGSKVIVDFTKLSKTVQVVVRFLDDMIEVNNYVLPETESIVRRGNRKIGVGVIGFAHLLYELGIPYNSEQAVRLADQIGSFIHREAYLASEKLAKKRGAFPNFAQSLHFGKRAPRRNCTILTIAPTGSVSIIANTTSGVEPVFSLVFKRNTFYHADQKNRPTHVQAVVDPYLENKLKAEGIYSTALIDKIADHQGSLQDIDEVSAQIRKTFVVTHDINWKWHVKIQAAWQKNYDNAVSKTINFPKTATVEDVENAYMLAWRLGCKGITIYRDQSKQDQVLVTGKH